MIDFYIIKVENVLKFEIHQNGGISNVVNL